MGKLDATAPRWPKGATRGPLERPEWRWKTHGIESGPADAGVSAPPFAVTVRQVAEEWAPRRTTRFSPIRFHGAHPCRKG